MSRSTHPAPSQSRKLIPILSGKATPVHAPGTSPRPRCAADTDHPPGPPLPKITLSSHQISNAAGARRVQLQKPSPPPQTSSCHINSSSLHHPAPSTVARRNPFQPTYSRTHFSLPLIQTAKMPPKAADKKPASKAPATASKAPEKKDAGKKTAASGDKKKRTKSRKETYSSYIYKGK